MIPVVSIMVSSWMKFSVQKTNSYWAPILSPCWQVLPQTLYAECTVWWGTENTLPHRGLNQLSWETVGTENSGPYSTFLRTLQFKKDIWRRPRTEFWRMSNGHSARHGGRKGGIHVISEGWLGRKEGRGRRRTWERRKLGRDANTEVIALRRVTRGFQIADLKLILG